MCPDFVLLLLFAFGTGLSTGMVWKIWSFVLYLDTVSPYLSSVFVWASFLLISRLKLRFLQGALSLANASSRTTSLKSAICTGLSDSSCAGGGDCPSQHFAPVCHVSRAAHAL